MQERIVGIGGVQDCFGDIGRRSPTPHQRLSLGSAVPISAGRFAPGGLNPARRDRVDSHLRCNGLTKTCGVRHHSCLGDAEQLARVSFHSLRRLIPADEDHRWRGRGRLLDQSVGNQSGQLDRADHINIDQVPQLGSKVPRRRLAGQYIGPGVVDPGLNLAELLKTRIDQLRSVRGNSKIALLDCRLSAGCFDPRRGLLGAARFARYVISNREVPALASAMATARPIPLDPPVMTADVPAKPVIGYFFSYSFRNPMNSRR